MNLPSSWSWRRRSSSSSSCCRRDDLFNHLIGHFDQRGYGVVGGDFRYRAGVDGAGQNLRLVTV